MLLEKCHGYAIHSGEGPDALPFQVYTDDGRGNGDFAAEFSMLETARNFCSQYPFDSETAAAEADEAANARDDYGDHDYSMNG